MEFTMNINLDNAAFEDENGPIELARILTKAAKYVEQCSLLGKGIGNNLRDSNGNSIGEYDIDD